MAVRLLIPVLVVTMALAACSTAPDPVASERTLAYSKILVGTNQVGWVEKRQNVDADGVRTVIDLVKDMNFDVRGYIRANGRAVKVVVMAPAHRDALGEGKKYVDLPAASRDHLARLMLDLPLSAKVSFAVATSSDIRGK